MSPSSIHRSMTNAESGNAVEYPVTNAAASRGPEIGSTGVVKSTSSVSSAAIASTSPPRTVSNQRSPSSLASPIPTLLPLDETALPRARRADVRIGRGGGLTTAGLSAPGALESPLQVVRQGLLQLDQPSGDRVFERDPPRVQERAVQAQCLRLVAGPPDRADPPDPGAPVGHRAPRDGGPAGPGGRLQQRGPGQPL